MIDVVIGCLLGVLGLSLIHIWMCIRDRSMLGAKMFGQDVFTPQTRLFNPDHDKVLEQAKQLSLIHI